MTFLIQMHIPLIFAKSLLSECK